jgi:predicted nuclease of restriction endonuclease-like (RecB) superfamily
MAVLRRLAIHQLQNFLVELGTGFAFVGRQVNMEVSDCDFS